MEEIKPRIVVIGGGDKAFIVVIGYLEEIKPRIVVIGEGILGGDKASYRSDRRRDTWILGGSDTWRR